MTSNNSRNELRTRTTAALTAAIATIAFSGAASAQDAPSYPKFKTLRFDENWSQFDPSTGNDYWDDIKHHNLTDDGENWVGMGGELRYRTESWNSFGFSPAPTADDSFGLGRIQLYTDWHFGENFRIFIEGESAWATDRDLPGSRRGLDVDQLDLQNAFADIVFPFGDSADKVTFRLGRQGLSFGKQRLVSTLPWANSQRSWDGGRAIVNVDDWRIDGFWTRYTPVAKYKFNDWRLGPDFWGVYATGKVGENDSIGLDLYYLGVEYDTARTYNGTTGIEDRHTFGARAFGKFGDSGFGYDIEGAYQFGDVGMADVNAFMFATQLTYAFKDTDWNPKMYVGFDYSSGDDTAGDTDVETFNQLFPLGHAYNGFMDLIGRQNITDISAGLSFKPHKKFLVKLDYHIFSRSSDADSVYNAGGGVLRATTVGASDDVGQEIDLTVKYLVDRHLTLQAGYSHFFSGDYFTDTSGGTADEDIDFFYFQAVYKF